MAIDNDAFGQALEKRIAKIEADRETAQTETSTLGTKQNWTI